MYSYKEIIEEQRAKLDQNAEKTLSTDGVKFIEKGLAGHYYEDSNFLSGPEDFSSLNFDKIFHDGSHSSGSDITQYRHTEVVCEGGIPIPEIIRGIVCRSIAEKQTLLFLLKNSAYNKYLKYKNIISFKPGIDVFYNNGIFIKKVTFEEDTFYIELNDSNRRYNINNATGKDVNVDIHVDAIGENEEILRRYSGYGIIDYGKAELLKFKPKDKINSNNILIKVTFDGCLIYQNILNIEKFEIV